VQLHPGDRVDHYTLLEPLGEGGQGAVWKVLDPRDGGVVRALKLVALAETGPAAFERARREARILAAAKHPALVTCHSLFEEPRAGLVGLVMDLAPGQSLAEVADEGRLDRGRALAVIAQLADVLAYIHGAGLSHRDLKPENVIVGEGFWEDPGRPGAVKLVDFGIAAPAMEATKLTAPGAVIGTVPYLAPELVDPATWGRGTGPSRDVFALGVLAYRLLTGKHPTRLGFDAALIDFARAYKAAQAGRIPWPPPGLEGTWGAAIAACLALRPADRPEDGAAVLRLLRGATPPREPSRPSVSGPTSTHEPARVSVRTEPMPVAPTAPARPRPAEARTIPAAPVTAAVVAARPRKRSGLWWAGLLGGGLGVAVVIGSVLLDSIGDKASPISSAPAVVTSSPLLSQAPTRAPTSPHAPVGVEKQDLGACCPRDKMCTGPTSFPQTVCRRTCSKRVALQPEASWKMRVYSVTRDGQDVVELYQTATLEMSAKGRTQKINLGQVDAGGTGDDRLLVTTQDIDDRRVLFKLSDGDTTIAKGPGRVKDHPIYATALCAGLYLYLDTDAEPPYVVTVYLDP
jgi:serine/threonine-protein kinase